ncbi:MAG TPA: cupredoxin domain-containing protein [Anaerolineales bacterium]|nr:cupredoxin domain-containing protein [Anaerolineales bacterium]
MKKYAVIVAMFVGLMLSSCKTGGLSTAIDVTMTDFQFTPNSFTIPAGREITINAVNTGVVEHQFAILNFGADAGDEFGEEDTQNIYWEVKVPPGQTVALTFAAPSTPGEYSVVCGVPGHLMAGMVGELTVIAGE